MLKRQFSPDAWHFLTGSGGKHESSGGLCRIQLPQRGRHVRSPRSHHRADAEGDHQPVFVRHDFPSRGCGNGRSRRQPEAKCARQFRRFWPFAIHTIPQAGRTCSALPVLSELRSWFLRRYFCYFPERKNGKSSKPDAMNRYRYRQSESAVAKEEPEHRSRFAISIPIAIQRSYWYLSV